MTILPASASRARAVHLLADLAEIDAELAKLKVHGGRMGEKFMEDVDKT